MKALLVKEDGLIYAVEVPPHYLSEDGLIRYSESFNHGDPRLAYEADLASATKSAILVADQEKARELVMLKSSMGMDKDGFYQPTIGVHPIPDLQWVKRDRWYVLGGKRYCRKVAILKESTPSELDTYVHKLENLSIFKKTQKEESTPSTEQESQELTTEEVEALKTVGIIAANWYAVSYNENTMPYALFADEAYAKGYRDQFSATSIVRPWPMIVKDYRKHRKP